MKVLLLGSGHWFQGKRPRCISCPTMEEYEYCIRDATQLVRLDNNSDMRPDVLATVHCKAWADKVIEAFGSHFDVIIDEITHMDLGKQHYETEAKKLLAEDGLFYGFRDKRRVKWLNSPQGLVLVRE